MDLETENRIAAILLREAAELRREAEKEGVRAYLEKPNARHRPNSRFLTATVRGVQQANKAVEVNEMWRLRNKELELNERLGGKSREESSSCQSEPDASCSTRSLGKRYAPVDENVASSFKSSRSTTKRWHSEVDDGLRDEEVDKFLQSRVKRGRGSVGSRMDETGPYIAEDADAMTEPSKDPDTGKRSVVLGPKSPPSLRRNSNSSSEEELHERARKKPKDHAKTSKKKHGKKHEAKEKTRNKMRIKEEKRRKREKG